MSSVLLLSGENNDLYIDNPSNPFTRNERLQLRTTARISLRVQYLLHPFSSTLILRLF